MYKLQCLKCGSIGYSASAITACECGGKCTRFTSSNDVLVNLANKLRSLGAAKWLKR